MSLSNLPSSPKKWSSPKQIHYPYDTSNNKFDAQKYQFKNFMSKTFCQGLPEIKNFIENLNIGWLVSKKVLNSFARGSVKVWIEKVQNKYRTITLMMDFIKESIESIETSRGYNSVFALLSRLCYVLTMKGSK